MIEEGFEEEEFEELDNNSEEKSDKADLNQPFSLNFISELNTLRDALTFRKEEVLFIGLSIVFGHFVLFYLADFQYAIIFVAILFCYGVLLFYLYRYYKIKKRKVYDLIGEVSHYNECLTKENQKHKKQQIVQRDQKVTLKVKEKEFVKIDSLQSSVLLKEEYERLQKILNELETLQKQQEVEIQEFDKKIGRYFEISRLMKVIVGSISNIIERLDKK
ncbi:hypothetical protein [Croceivirga thetidis]|uniref:Uncharacterized protein n=1 Tax=Croceivirga thetidis TaxID=2721623 RepID=A0ABX1GR57_9FLAO|nr:hypothetical protein [Croceivirga thetidis]NKI31257.1 hypothetical protein [Croceivirga thetidis]